MKKQENTAGRRVAPGFLLWGAPRRTLHHAIDQRHGQLAGGVAAPAIDDDDLDRARAHGLQRTQGGFDIGGLVQRGNDDGKTHAGIVKQGYGGGKKERKNSSVAGLVGREQLYTGAPKA